MSPTSRGLIVGRESGIFCVTIDRQRPLNQRRRPGPGRRPKTGPFRGGTTILLPETNARVRICLCVSQSVFHFTASGKSHWLCRICILRSVQCSASVSVSVSVDYCRVYLERIPLPLLVAWVGAIGQWAPLNHLLASPFHQTHQTHQPPPPSQQASKSERTEPNSSLLRLLLLPDRLGKFNSFVFQSAHCPTPLPRPFLASLARPRPGFGSPARRPPRSRVAFTPSCPPCRNGDVPSIWDLQGLVLSRQNEVTGR
jgi:hypothetical protein